MQAPGWKASVPGLTPLYMRERELVERIGWFIRLRWLAATGVWIALAIAHNRFQAAFPLAPALGTVAAIYLCNIVFVLVDRRLRRGGRLPDVRASRLFANIQVIADLMTLTLLIHYLGGSEICFIVFYFFHMIIASILLPPWNSYALALLASTLVASLIWGEYFGLLSHYSLFAEPPKNTDRSLDFCLMRTGVISFSLFLSVYFASSIANRLRQRERQLEQAFARLQSAEEQKSFFMRKASHELRSPLSAIQSFVHVFLKGLGGEVTEDQRRIFLRMKARVESMLAMVDDLLRLSRLRDAEEQQRPAKPVDLADIVRHTCELMTPWAEEKGVRFSTHLHRAVIQGEPEGLEQVASNLISNAIKYTPSGGEVEVRLKRAGREALLSVRDTGIGLTEQDRAQLFQEFFRSATAKKMTESGTGLGLSITRKIVEMHGGRIAVESKPDKGSRFEVRLPAVE